jgi:hypothetical protein
MHQSKYKIILPLLPCLLLLPACVRSVSTLPVKPPLQPTLLETLSPFASPSPESVSLTPLPTGTIETLPTPEPTTDVEYPVTVIPLSAPLADPQAQISGMAWYSDTLVLLPQYPDRFGDAQAGALFTLPKAEILDYLDGKSNTPLNPHPLPFFDPGIEQLVPGFEGYEALAFDGNTVYLTIEARPASMLGYLVRGTLSPDLSAIRLDTSRLTPIQPQTNISNMGYESLLVFGGRLVTLYEANGAAINPNPIAPMFDKDLLPADQLPFPNIEYRITDATPPDLFGTFWAINYFYPGDTSLKPASDPLVEQYGKGPTHTRFETVERLVEFQFSEDGIVFSETPPIQLVLIDDNHSRNWEAIARLEGRGFLLATDQYPESIFGFVSYHP